MPVTVGCLPDPEVPAAQKIPSPAGSSGTGSRKQRYRRDNNPRWLPSGAPP